MSKKKRKFAAEFKAKVVLELLTSGKTINEIALKYEILPKSLRRWKEEFVSNSSLVFNKKNIVKPYKEEVLKKEKELEEVHKELGKAVVEREWLAKKLNSLDLTNKKALVESELKTPSISRQCELLDVSRSSYYYNEKFNIKKVTVSNEIMDIFEKYAFYGYRKIYHQLLKYEYDIGINTVRYYMQDLGITAIYPKPRTTQRNQEHKIYSYKLRKLKIERPNQVWSVDITYIKIKGGTVYLAAVIDWYSKALLSYSISTTMDVSLVTDTLEEALNKYGVPEILNSDQGSQYTARKHIEILKANGISVSMNGKGRSIDNIAIERFFRSLKYECIYLNDYETTHELMKDVAAYMNFYNNERFHQSLNYKDPMTIYLAGVNKLAS